MFFINTYMAISKEKKKGILAKVETILKDASSLAFVNFHGLSVSHTTEVRRKLREAGVGYYVAKKSLLRKALEKHKVEGSMPDLEGELAIAYSKDLIAPAREVVVFQKKLEKGIKLVGGIFENRVMNQEEIMVIATIPPVQTLHAQFVNLINSPIQRFVVSLSEIGKKKV